MATLEGGCTGKRASMCKSHRSLLLGVASAGWLCVSEAAVALPLSVTESGDFSGSGLSPTAVGTLDAGINTISGDTADSAPFPDSDFFSVTLPGGFSITGISLSVSSFVDGSLLSSLVLLSSPSSGFESFNGDGTVTVDPFTISGTTVVIDVRGDGGFDVPGRDTFDYTVSITAIPEPATALLVGLGLAGVAAASRRRPVRSV